jgi:hypothetical protein
VSSCCCSCCLRTKAWGGHYVVSQNFLCWSCILITKKKWTVKKCATELELPGNRTACPELTPATFFHPCSRANYTTQTCLTDFEPCMLILPSLPMLPYVAIPLLILKRAGEDWYGLIRHDLRFSDFTPTTVIPHKITGESSQPRRESAHAAPCSFGIANAVGHAQRWLLVCWV